MGDDDAPPAGGWLLRKALIELVGSDLRDRFEELTARCPHWDEPRIQILDHRTGRISGEADVDLVRAARDACWRDLVAKGTAGMVVGSCLAAKDGAGARRTDIDPDQWPRLMPCSGSDDVMLGGERQAAFRVRAVSAETLASAPPSKASSRPSETNRTGRPAGRDASYEPFFDRIVAARQGNDSWQAAARRVEAEGRDKGGAFAATWAKHVVSALLRARPDLRSKKSGGT